MSAQYKVSNAKSEVTAKFHISMTQTAFQDLRFLDSQSKYQHLLPWGSFGRIFTNRIS